jgi:hemerythrin
MEHSMFVWQAQYALGFGDMDDTHREFVELVDTLLTCRDDAAHAALDALAAHLERHFEEEEQWMLRTAFPSAQCHLDEHAAVLKSLGEVKAVVREGRLDVARSFARALAGWFPEHTQAMDMGLAKWMVKRRLGGEPLVIRRPAARMAEEV